MQNGRLHGFCASVLTFYPTFGRKTEVADSAAKRFFSTIFAISCTSLMMPCGIELMGIISKISFYNGFIIGQIRQNYGGFLT
jgi:hypothetical protein